MPEKRIYSAEKVRNFMQIYHQIVSLERLSSFMVIASNYNYNPAELKKLLAKAKTMPKKLRNDPFKQSYSGLEKALETSKDFRKI